MGYLTLEPGITNSVPPIVSVNVNLSVDPTLFHNTPTTVTMSPISPAPAQSTGSAIWTVTTNSASGLEVGGELRRPVRPMVSGSIILLITQRVFLGTPETWFSGG